jgi:hypothetical protein
VSQSAITSNIEIRMSAPWPVRLRPISASRMDACAVALGSAGDRGEAALGLDQQVIGLAVGIGAGVAISGDRAHDQLRIVLAQPLAREAEFVHRAGLQILQQNVGARDQPFQLCAAVLGGEVDHGGILAALCRGVVATGEIALGPLDLDDMGARIGQA